MSAFNGEDLKKLIQLSGAIKRAHFKDLSIGEVMGVALAADWLGDLQTKIEHTIKNDKKMLEEINIQKAKVVEIEALLAKKKKK
jgi:hypothetical protein